MYLKEIGDKYKPLHPDIYVFDYKFIADGTRKWLESDIQECDEDGIPTCVERKWLGVYCFEFLKPEYNVKWMEEIAHFKQFCIDNRIPA